MNSTDKRTSRDAPSTNPAAPPAPGAQKDSANDTVDEASLESFPASDAPAWSVPQKRKKLKAKTA